MSRNLFRRKFNSLQKNSPYIFSQTQPFSRYSQNKSDEQQKKEELDEIFRVSRAELLFHSQKEKGICPAHKGACCISKSQFSRKNSFFFRQLHYYCVDGQNSLGSLCVIPTMIIVESICVFFKINIKYCLNKKAILVIIRKMNMYVQLVLITSIIKHHKSNLIMVTM